MMPVLSEVFSFCLLILQAVVAFPEALPAAPETSAEKFPYHALVKGKLICNGVLLNEHYVLTPASCVYGVVKVHVFLGFQRYPYFPENHHEVGGQIDYSEHIVVHDDFVKVEEHRFLNNVALLKLANGAKLSSTIQPAILMGKEAFAGRLIGKYAHVTGWALSQNTALKMVKVLVRNEDTCHLLFGDAYFRNQEICGKWPHVERLNVLGNPVNVDGKVVGFQTETPPCTIRSSSCSQSDMVLVFAPFLEWIAHVIYDDDGAVSFLKSLESDSKENDELHQVVKKLEEQHRHDVDELQHRMEDDLRDLKEKQESNYVDWTTKLDEQIADMKSEIGKNVAKHDGDVLKLQEEFGNAKTEITNDLSNLRNGNKLLEDQIKALDSLKPEQDKRLGAMEGLLEDLNTQTDSSRHSVQVLGEKLAKELGIVKLDINNLQETALEEKDHIKHLHLELNEVLKNSSLYTDYKAAQLDRDLRDLNDKVNENELIGHGRYLHLNDSLGKLARDHWTGQKTHQVIESEFGKSKAYCDELIVGQAKYVDILANGQKVLEGRLEHCCPYPYDYGAQHETR